MTSNQMRLAVADIYAGKTFLQSLIPKTLENHFQWEELANEIQDGFPIDNQRAA